MADRNRSISAARWLRSVAWVFVGALLAWTWLIAFERGRAPDKYDFKHFYLDAEYVWQHGALNPTLDDPTPEKNRQLPFYLPTVAVLIAPFAAGGREFGAALWATAQAAAFLWCLLVLWRWCCTRRAGAHADLTFVTLLGLGLPTWYEATKFNQVSWFTLALLLTGVAALERRRAAAAGAWFAAAATLKILPALFVVWLLQQRRWRAVAAFGVTAILIIAGPSVAAFGWERTIDYHREWWEYNVANGGPRKWLTTEDWGPHSEHFVDRRNQSIAAVIGRWCWPEHRYRLEWQPLALSLDQCLRFAQAVSFALGIALLWATRRRLPPSADAPWPLRGGFALYAIALLVLAPLSRMYYLVWVWPALTLLLWFATPADPRAPGAAAARWGVLAWVLGMAAWLWRPLRESGVHLLMLVSIAFVVWWVSLRRLPASEPETESGRVR